jgi:hypothetical protein
MPIPAEHTVLSIEEKWTYTPRTENAEISDRKEGRSSCHDATHTPVSI